MPRRVSNVPRVANNAALHAPNSRTKVPLLLPTWIESSEPVTGFSEGRHAPRPFKGVANHGT